MSPNILFLFIWKALCCFYHHGMKVSFSQCLRWWHLLCFRGELSDSQWRTWSTHHAGLIYFKFCRVCVTSDLSRDRIDVAIACCCFVLGTKKAKHQDKAWRIMLCDRQGLLSVDVAGRACDCSLCLCVWPWVTITWSRNGRQFFHGFALNTWIFWLLSDTPFSRGIKPTVECA